MKNRPIKGLDRRTTNQVAFVKRDQDELNSVQGSVDEYDDVASYGEASDEGEEKRGGVDRRVENADEDLPSMTLNDAIHPSILH